MSGRKNRKANINIFSCNFYTYTAILWNSFFCNIQLSNDFDPRNSKCLISYKKDLFEYFLTNISKEAKKFNQKIIFVTFNSQEDLRKDTNWRYEYIANYFIKNNIKHIDSLKVMKKKLSENNENLQDYFGTDNHNSIKSFQYIYDEFIKVYKAM